jgi:hypothetical protein
LRLAKAFARISNGLLSNHKPRRFSLRTQLVLLVLAVVLPLLVLAAVMFLRDVQFQRAALERGMKDTARALSLALDREVGKLHAVLETLAVSPSLDSRDFKPSTSLLYERLSNARFQDCPLRPLGPADHKHTPAVWRFSTNILQEAGRTGGN